MRLWGVAGSPSLDTLAEGDAPLSPELNVGADGDAVDWNAPRGVTYGRRGEILLPTAAHAMIPEIGIIACILMQ